MAEEIVLQEDEQPSLDNLHLRPDARAEQLEGQIEAELRWGKCAREEGERRFAKMASDLAAYAVERCWERRGFDSMTQFLAYLGQKWGYQMTSMFNLLRIGIKVLPHLSQEQIVQLGKSKLSLIANHTETGTAPDRRTVEFAATVSYEELEYTLRHDRARLQSETPEDFKYIKVQPFWIPKAGAEIVRDAFKLCRQLDGTDSRNQRFVNICERALAAMYEELAQQENV